MFKFVSLSVLSLVFSLAAQAELLPHFACVPNEANTGITSVLLLKAEDATEQGIYFPENGTSEARMFFLENNSSRDVIARISSLELVGNGSFEKRYVFETLDASGNATGEALTLIPSSGSSSVYEGRYSSSDGELNIELTCRPLENIEPQPGPGVSGHN